MCRVIMCLLTIYFVIEKPFSIDGKIDWYGCSMGAVQGMDEEIFFLIDIATPLYT